MEGALWQMGAREGFCSLYEKFQHKLVTVNMISLPHFLIYKMGENEKFLSPRIGMKNK